ncbi:MAG: hypothetical protein LUI39_13025 [Lachnospiraceae bacterium]|nr:hypothetical protein [Lachnospiraceae bacterium]
MELKKCPEGHYYDASVNAECPICQQIKMGGGSTIPFDNEPQDPESVTVSGGYAATEPVSGGVSATRPVDGAGATAPVEKTASVWGMRFLRTRSPTMAIRRRNSMSCWPRMRCRR